MLTIGLFPNTRKQGINTVLDWLIAYLTKKNVKILMPEEAAVILNYRQFACSRDQMTEQLSLALTLGGDGTLLNTAREIAAAGIPICGINMGQLGFLTDIELPELGSAMDKIINGEYHIEERLMLDAVIVRSDLEIAVSSALNDVVVAKGGFSRLIRLNLFIDDHLTATYPADGLIVATSTGSTGYSLSAGGPIVSPNLKVLIITPICPHTLHARSLVVSENEEVRVEIQATHDDIVLTVDGQTVYSLHSGDKIKIRRGLHRARFIKFSGKSYCDNIRTKLRRGDSDEII